MQIVPRKRVGIKLFCLFLFFCVHVAQIALSKKVNGILFLLFWQCEIDQIPFFKYIVKSRTMNIQIGGTNM